MFSNPIIQLQESLAYSKRMLEVINERYNQRYCDFKEHVENNIKQTELAIKVLKEYEMALNFGND